MTIATTSDEVGHVLPPSEATNDALTQIREHITRTKTWLVVLDDDPTGSQTVQQATLLVDPGHDELLQAARAQQLTFIWTNSRSLPAPAAADINGTLVRSAIDAAHIAGVQVVFVSRGDSTLRGHFAAELSATLGACAGKGEPVDGVVFAPAFLEAGRFTENDVHWVTQPDGHTVPAASTEFARDKTFGYREEKLTDWVLARTGMPAEKVRSLSPDDSRSSTDQLLLSVRDGDIVLANATTAAHLESIVLACQRAQRAGRRLVYRTGPSFVRALAGQSHSVALTPAELPGDTPGFGLTVVGSHTELTTRQLHEATRRHVLTVVELDVDALLDQDRREKTRREVVASLERALRVGHTALVTSRSVRAADNDPEASLAIARLVSDELCAIIHDLSPDVPLRYLVAKGGITSHEVAVRALGMRRATVLGQLFPGLVSVLRLGPETPRPGLLYVVFPGNVGSIDALADALSTLSAA
jgi:uncharacterized protein YgbK (DUF1537 family)